MKPSQKIPLERIDLSDETYSVRFMADVRDLRSSIREVGLIQPVLLKEKPHGYQVISGFRRIAALRELGFRDVDSSVTDEADGLRLFTMTLHDNVTGRGLNAVEKAITLDKLIHQFRVDRALVIRDFLPLLSLETHEKILNTFLSLARMEDDVKRFVLGEAVSRSNIRILSTFHPEDRIALLKPLSSLKLGENRLREILTLLDEISRRDRIRIKEILLQPAIQTPLSHEEWTPSQKTEEFKRTLLQLRYPRRHHLEEEFQQRRASLHLPPGIALDHAANFEGKRLKMEFQFESVEDLRTILSSLNNLADKKELEEILRNA
jgi:ParB family transcriptional regulator, chromosome partitioning protein